MKLDTSPPYCANSKGGILHPVQNKHKHRHECTLGGGEEVVLEVKAEGTNCLLMSRQHSARRNCYPE